jgi:hypothetical protein
MPLVAIVINLIIVKMVDRQAVYLGFVGWLYCAYPVATILVRLLA